MYNFTEEVTLKQFFRREISFPGRTGQGGDRRGGKREVTQEGTGKRTRAQEQETQI